MARAGQARAISVPGLKPIEIEYRDPLTSIRRERSLTAHNLGQTPTSGDHTVAKFTQALTRESLITLLKARPGLVFYRPAVDEVLKRGELAEIKALIKGARDVKAKYGDIDGLISKLEAATKKAQ